MKITSSYANKLIRSLNEDKVYWLKLENSSCTYTATASEEPLIPDYDYAKVTSEIETIDRKICALKHALNITNSTAKIPVRDEILSVDVILVRMAQLSSRKTFLDSLRKQPPKVRTENSYYARKAEPEYIFINYDLDVVKADYEKVCSEIMELQIALDKYNQTFEFEVDI